MAPDVDLLAELDAVDTRSLAAQFSKPLSLQRDAATLNWFADKITAGDQ